MHEVGVHTPASRSAPHTFFMPAPPHVNMGLAQGGQSFHLPQLSPMRSQY
jgi:hypothetical protein